MAAIKPLFLFDVEAQLGPPILSQALLLRELSKSEKRKTSICKSHDRGRSDSGSKRASMSSESGRTA
eukprot:2001840-Prymnesium_polylepis.1